MSCLITGGINVSICRDNQPGVKRFLIANFDQVLSYDELNGVITGITMSGSSVFYEFKVNQNSSNVVQTPTVSVENGIAYWTVVATAVFGKLSVSTRNLAKTLAIGNFVVIAEDSNGLYWLFGAHKGAYLSGGSIATGTAGTDLNGWTAELTALEAYPSCEVDSTIIAGLLT